MRQLRAIMQTMMLLTSRNLLQAIPAKVELKWVKRHKDTTKNFDDLWRLGQMTVLADRLAGEFQQHHPESEDSCQDPHNLLSCRASLTLGGTTITSHLKSVL